MFKFLHHLFNPHCEECVIEKQHKLELERLIHLEESEELRYNNSCESCETLKTQLAYANHQNELLIARLLEKPNENQAMREAPLPLTKPSQHVSWNVRRQMLEQEDRAKAVAMSGAAKPVDKVQTIDEIEKELGVSNLGDGVNGNV